MCEHPETTTDQHGIETCCTCGMWRDLFWDCDDEPGPWNFEEDEPCDE